MDPAPVPYAIYAHDGSGANASAYDGFSVSTSSNDGPSVSAPALKMASESASVPRTDPITATAQDCDFIVIVLMFWLCAWIACPSPVLFRHQRQFIAESSFCQCRHDLLQYYLNGNQYQILREIFGLESLVRQRKFAFQLSRGPMVYQNHCNFHFKVLDISSIVSFVYEGV